MEALILAGGRGSRLGFQEKALIEFNGKPLIVHVISALEKVVNKVIISVRDKAQGELFSLSFPYMLVYDIYKNIGPISGIYSGLSACKNEYCFIAACDMPFINENVVRMLFKKSEGYDVAIPRWKDGSLEPLHAVYKCKPMIEETKKAIESGVTTILVPVFRLHINYVGMDEISLLDPVLRTFKNINTYEDMNAMGNE